MTAGSRRGAATATATRSASDGALAIHAVTPAAMAARTVALIQDWQADGRRPDQVAVLTRVNSALLPVQVALGSAGVPHTAPLDAAVLGRTGIRAALAYLRIALSPERIRREDVLDTINRPSRRVKRAVDPLLRRRARWSVETLTQILDSLDDPYAERFAGYLADIALLTRSLESGADTAEALEIIRTRIGLDDAMATLDSSRTLPQGSSHGDDLDALEQLSHLHETPETFREWLVERLREPGAPDGVTLSTVHRVKGMEWERVVVFAANAGLMPHRLADDIEEERRIFHVAITRCRERVAIVGAREHLSPFVGQLRRPAPSRSTPASDARVGGPVSPAPVTSRWRDDGTVVATPGLALVLPGGVAGRIVEARRDEIDVELEVGAVVSAPLSIPVRVGDRPARLRADGAATAASPSRLVQPDPKPGDTLDPADEALFEALRAWRARTAASSGVPPYVVFHDAHLRAIAARRPSTVRELARCPGVGPTKLERYGEDVLAVVDAGR